MPAYKFADKFDYKKHGRNIDDYCPILKGPCADPCPLPEGQECPDEGEWDMIITEKGFVVPDPLDSL